MGTDTAHLIEMYERAIPRTDAVVSNIDTDQFELSTPCTDWDVEHVLDHLVGGCITFGGGARGEKSGAISEPGNLGTDHVSAFRDASRAAAKAFRSADYYKDWDYPWGQSPPDAALHLALADMTVHGWDLAKATDQGFEPDEDIAEEILGFVTTMLEPEGKMPRGNSFAEPVDVGDDVPAVHRLVAYVGRNPEIS